jgi:TPR repeat protein/uncharacterized coiled-coil protein SlyX
MKSRYLILLTLSGALLVGVGEPVQPAHAAKGDEFAIVDCLLPGKVRRLGRRATFMTARRAIKTSASDCEIRGGEYTAFDRANYATALKIWLPAAEAGDPQAQNNVGEIFEKGLGGAPQYEIAAEWFRKAAEQGYSRAQINLGGLYERGQGVPKDMREAVKWYRKASGLSDANLAYVPDNVKEELKQLRSERDTLRQERDSLRRRLDDAQRSLNDARKKLGRQESRTRSTLQDLVRVKTALDEQRKKARQTGDNREVERLERELEMKKAEVDLRKRDLAALRDQVRVLGSDAAKLKTALAESESGRQQDVAKLRSEVKAAQDKLAQINAKLDGTMREMSSLRQSETVNRGQVARLRSELAQERKSASRDSGRIRQIEQELAQRESELAAKDRRLGQLNSEVADLQRQTVSLQKRQAAAGSDRAELARVNKQLNTSLSELASLRDAEAESRRDAARLQSQLAGERKKADQDKARIDEIQKALAAREKELAARNKRLAALNSKISELQRSAEKQAQQRAAPPKRTEPVSAAPVIEIIEPPLKRTRAAGEQTVSVKATAERLVIGRVKASKGLIALMVNDQEQQAGDDGLFKARIAVEYPKTRVQIVAIDGDGGRTALTFTMAPQGEPKEARVDRAAGAGVGNIAFGDYHALVIGNNDYANLPDLKSAVEDAKAVAALLRNQYGYKVTTLLNADRYAILSTLNKLREELTEENNLLIYYAGHGELDRVNDRGHWLPVDAEPGSSANWISNIQITDVLNAMLVRQVLVVADSCYSGTLTRAALSRLDAGMSNSAKHKWVKLMASKRSRVVLTSGGLEPVLDSGGGQHSVFANAFLKILRGNGGVLEAQKLYRQVAQNMASAAATASGQVPHYAPIKHAGHEAGDFFFVRAGN